ncbi:obscurin-like protein 1 [Nelusetta ayraudi]|uniref:obscurin-like protein 1 n=1 Tax=Nelusetta ayraudi TaxID=303726 RepID=UPI003F6E480B
MDFVVPLKDVSVPEKKQAKFECAITKDVAKVMWHRGDDVITSDQKYDIIDDGKKHMLVINCCEFEDEDDYTVAVLGRTSTARLAVEGIRLKVVSPLRDQTVKEGATARFELELSHDDVPVTWYRNEVKVHPSRTLLTLAEGRRHVLEIKDVTLDDICQVKAEAKGVPCMANLTVIEGDAYFTVKLQDYTAVEKDQVVLECELNKEVDVIWYRNQAEVRPSKTVAVRAEGRRRTLVLKRVGHEDAGQYTCDCGTDKTTAALHIEARQVKVLRPLYGAEVFDGETARFQVELSEDDVHGQWKLNGQVLDPTADVEIVEDGAKHTLVLYNCKVPQTGEVAFSAANARCQANLKVKELPVSFITPLSDLHVYERDEAKS